MKISGSWVQGDLGSLGNFFSVLVVQSFEVRIYFNSWLCKLHAIWMESYFYLQVVPKNVDHKSTHMIQQVVLRTIGITLIIVDSTQQDLEKKVFSSSSSFPYHSFSLQCFQPKSVILHSCIGLLLSFRFNNIEVIIYFHIPIQLIPH